LHRGWRQEQFDRESFIVFSIVQASGGGKGDFQKINPYRDNSEAVAQSKAEQNKIMEAQAQAEFGTSNSDWGLF